jgi:hypothetical protein
MQVRALISPLTKAAYFDAYLDVAVAEFEACGFEVNAKSQLGEFDFFDVDASEDDLRKLTRLSVVQGLFSFEGEAMLPLNVGPEFSYPEALVYGQKYQGKTNELVTQLAINVGLQALPTQTRKLSLLDPMAGRGTTLLWALRYGLDARGIEIDKKAAELFYAHVKKQCKLERVKHSGQRGRIGKQKKQGDFSRFKFGEQSLIVINADSRQPEWCEGKRFDLVVTDLPYGIQHTGDMRRSSMSVVEECVPGWCQSLKSGGAMVIVFNDYQTKRSQLSALFQAHGLEVQGFAAPHRMSEAIVRDLIVFKNAASR